MTSDQATDRVIGGRYRLVRKLGSGGHGEVFLAQDLAAGSERQVVAKLLRATLASDPELLARFRAEARTLAALDHPNIVRVLDTGTTEKGQPFFTMEYLPGTTLAIELAQRGFPPLRRALEDVRQVLAALGAAHALGFVHRDVKTSNLFVTHAPDGERVIKLLDFGVAKIIAGSPQPATIGASVPTAEGTVIGTPRVMPPEQGRGRAVDARADIYGCGLLLYLLVARRGPFDHLADEQDVIRAHMEDVPVAPSCLLPQPVPPALDQIILKALAKDPAARYQSAEALSQALAPIEEQLPRSVGVGGSPENTVLRPPLSEATTLSPTERRRFEDAETASGHEPNPSGSAVSRDQRRRIALTWVALFGTALVLAATLAASVVAWLISSPHRASLVPSELSQGGAHE